MAQRRKSVTDIETIKDIYKALGGIDVTADWLGTCRSSVGMWITNDRVSNGHQLRVYLSLKGRGCRRINPKLFDFKSWDEAVMPRLRIRAAPHTRRAA